jgi:hypothetical protein
MVKTIAPQGKYFLQPCCVVCEGFLGGGDFPALVWMMRDFSLGRSGRLFGSLLLFSAFEALASSVF